MKKTVQHHQITLSEAIKMTSQYRKERPENFPICETFDALSVQALLQTPNCAFIRLYYGMKDNYLVHLIIVAADKNGNDILPASKDLISTEDEEIILEDSVRCPNVCPPESPLNS